MFKNRLGFFPGSTLGNFAQDDAVAFLSSARRLLCEDGRLLLGIDLAKDVDTLLAAYDDAEGITAAFNLNLLARMNRELDADFDLGAFGHRASWDGARSRIEMHLVSRCDQVVTLGSSTFPLRFGETIHTENSYKYDLDSLTAMFTASGWTVERRWISKAPTYGLFLLRS